LCDVGRVAVKHCFKLLSFLHLFLCIGLVIPSNRGLPYYWLSLCTFYTTLLPRYFADAAVICNYRDDHTYSQIFLYQQTPY